MGISLFRGLADACGLGIRQRHLVSQIIDLADAVPSVESSDTKGDAHTLKIECDLKNGILLTLAEERAPGRRELVVEARWKNQVVFGLTAETEGSSGAAVQTEYLPGDWESTLEARWSLIYAL